MIITQDSAGGMVDIHDRRPEILTPDIAHECMDSAILKDRAEYIVLHTSEPSEEFEWFKADALVGNARSKGPDLIQPICSQEP